MAIKSTIFKLELSISDINRNYYQDHLLTVARHPSETDIRMLLRLVAFALNAHEYLVFTKGLSNIDEPDLWQKSLTGDIQHWIDLGQPTDKRIRQSCGKAAQVSIYTYQKRAAHLWFDSIKDKLDRFKNLSITHLVLADESKVEKLIDRSMHLNCMIQDQQIHMSNESDSLTIEMECLKKS